MGEAMGWRRLAYELAYFGRPPWDTGIPPPELVEAIEGTAALAPGRALDIGCGTGTSSRYLTAHGWQVVGVDFSTRAIRRAWAASDVGAGITFLRADATDLVAAGVSGPFDLVLDVGCYHGIAQERRDAYVASVVAVSRPGTTMLLFGFDRPGVPGLNEAEVRRRFQGWFAIERLHAEDPPAADAGAWFRMRAIDA
jgi:SAM-dependent methyltransferase